MIEGDYFYAWEYEILFALGAIVGHDDDDGRSITRELNLHVVVGCLKDDIRIFSYYISFD